MFIGRILSIFVSFVPSWLNFSFAPLRETSAALQF